MRGNGSGTIDDICLHYRREPFWTIPEWQPQLFRFGTVPLGMVTFKLKLGMVLERSERFLKTSANGVLDTLIDFLGNKV